MYLWNSSDKFNKFYWFWFNFDALADSVFWNLLVHILLELSTKEILVSHDTLEFKETWVTKET